VQILEPFAGAGTARVVAGFREVCASRSIAARRHRAGTRRARSPPATSGRPRSRTGARR
jgi:hypothetical protein